MPHSIGTGDALFLLKSHSTGHTGARTRSSWSPEAAGEGELLHVPLRLAGHALQRLPRLTVGHGDHLGEAHEAEVHRAAADPPQVPGLLALEAS